MNHQINPTSHTKSPIYHVGLMWFRRDLRASDNAALFHALKYCKAVHCVFVFDENILQPLPKNDRRITFIQKSLEALDEQLKQLAQTPEAGLVVCQGNGILSVVSLAKTVAVQAVFTNHDDEPTALARDQQVLGALANMGIAFHTYKDHCLFERQEILNQQGKPYGVFTPYKNAHHKKLQEKNGFYMQAYPVEKYAHHLAKRPKTLQTPVPTLAEIGFEENTVFPLKVAAGEQGAQTLLVDFVPRMHSYAETRNFPAWKGPSYLSVHLRFGTVSIRQLFRLAWEHLQKHIANGNERGKQGTETWLNELIWRDFYFQILSNFPHVTHRSFKPEYDAIVWEHGDLAQKNFAAWCDGKTGYPLVDAAMKQLNQTGYMHNRLRMVVACFLTKDLGIDWRWGEAYFALHLNDFDLSANNGGWQWASSSGCDAQPYFRIFNPITQSEKFDETGKFIRKYLPQLAELPNSLIHAPWLAAPEQRMAAGVVLGDGFVDAHANYPRRLVDHNTARLATLARYEIVKKNKSDAM